LDHMTPSCPDVSRIENARERAFAAADPRRYRRTSLPVRGALLQRSQSAHVAHFCRLSLSLKPCRGLKGRRHAYFDRGATAFASSLSTRVTW
jgi:hypothetical protein